MTGGTDLIGDDQLAGRVSRWGGSGTGSIYKLAELVPKLRDEERIGVTFDNEEASRRSVDLISLRHPVVRAAVRHFAQQPHGIKRFGSVRVPDLTGTADRYLVVLYLAATTGLRPSLELWPLAVHLATGEINEEVGFQLLSGVAKGLLQDGETVAPESLVPHLTTLEGHALGLQLRTERRRRHENEVMVDSRIATQSASFADKIRRAEAILDQVTREGKGASVQRMHRSRINNLRQRRTEQTTKLQEGRELAVTLQPVAVAVISG